MTPDVLIAAWPDPAQPTVVALGAALGALLGDTVGRLLRRDFEGRMRLAHELGYGGCGFAFALYLIANLSGGVS